MRLPSEPKPTLRCHPARNIPSCTIPTHVFGFDSATVEVVGDGSNVEDPLVVVGLLEVGLIAWANDWAATVLTGDNVTIDEAGTT